MGGTGSVNSPYESSPRKLLVQGEICGKESAPLISPIKNGKCSDEAQNRSVQRNRTVSFCKRRGIFTLSLNEYKIIHLNVLL